VTSATHAAGSDRRGRTDSIREFFLSATRPAENSVNEIYSAIREKQGDEVFAWQDFIEISRKPRIGVPAVAE
jgi:hypothetical protein